MNTSELKFILTALTQIDRDDKEFTQYEIKVSDLEERLQVKQNETRLKQFAKKLLSKPLEVPTKKKVGLFSIGFLISSILLVKLNLLLQFLKN